MADQQEQEQHGGAELDRDQFCCSVCLDLLKEPVTIHCGHSYCKCCIEGCWDQEEERGEYSCPQCREPFNPRPVLRRNNMLAEVMVVVEMLKRTSTQQPPPPAAGACAGPADVSCDFCCGTRRNKATMSCLTCLASYCPAHLEAHYSFPVLKIHKLVSATTPLQEKMCTEHGKLMEIYCRRDKKCVCYLCVIDEHKQHRTVSAAAERALEQEQLIVIQNEVQEKFQEREKELQELVQVLKDFKSCSQTAVETIDEIFDELISSIKKKHTLAKQLMEAREQTAVAQAEELQLQLQEEITKLRRRHADLDRLSQLDDNIHFIQTFQSLSTSCESSVLPPGPVVRPKHSFPTVADCVSKLKDDIESLLNDTCPRICATVSTIDVVLPPVPKTREEFLRYCSPLTLDVNSAYKYLSLSQENLRVSRGIYDKSYPAHSDRFISVSQVLCREGLSERCYWEVSLSNNNGSVAVSYKDISRTRDSGFGKNHKSWSLECSKSAYSFQHDEASMTVSGPQSSRIGVYLDYKSGTLSFYSIADTMTLLHKERTTFTQPLYPGFGLVTSGSSIELIKLW